jgi:hypothetical protein
MESLTARLSQGATWAQPWSLPVGTLIYFSPTIEIVLPVLSIGRA